MFTKPTNSNLPVELWRTVNGWIHLTWYQCVSIPDRKYFYSASKVKQNGITKACACLLKRRNATARRFIQCTKHALSGKHLPHKLWCVQDWIARTGIQQSCKLKCIEPYKVSIGQSWMDDGKRPATIKMTGRPRIWASDFFRVAWA